MEMEVISNGAGQSPPPPNTETLIVMDALEGNKNRSNSSSSSSSTSSQLPPSGGILTQTNKHNFRVKTFNTLTFCDYCAGLLWGICEQGFQCSDCHFNVHSACIIEIKDSCKMIKMHHHHHNGGGNQENTGTEVKKPTKEHTFMRGSKSIKRFCNVCRETTFTISSDCFVCKDCKYIAHEQCRARAPHSCKILYNYHFSHGKSTNNHNQDHIIDINQLNIPRVINMDINITTTTTTTTNNNENQSNNSHLTLNQHHWVEGNLKTIQPCIVCLEKIETGFSMAHYKCSWCHQHIHSSCFNKQGMVCDFGELKEMIIPPSSVLMSIESNTEGAIKSSKGIEMNEQSVPDKLNWKLVSPIPPKTLFIFINSKSGGQMGMTFLRKFSNIVNPLQLIDLIHHGPDHGIKIIDQYLKEHPQDADRIRLLVCGGDGTVGWVLQVLKKYNLPPIPISIIPLGTGNDMSRSLGWGPGYNGESLPGILKEISHSKLTKLDTWDLSIKYNNNQNNQQQPLQEDKSIVMNNYFSIGLDASIALGFHEARNANPQLFIGRTINKIWYGKIGLGEFVTKNFVSLASVLEIRVDDVEVVIDKAIEGIMIINVNNYAGGVDLWRGKSKQFKPLEIDDKLMEIVGVKGLPHLGTIISGINTPIKIAQGHKISITYNSNNNISKKKSKKPKTSIAVQVDGEPFKVTNCTIDITFQRQVSMLVHKDFHTKSLHKEIDVNRDNILSEDEDDDVVDQTNNISITNQDLPITTTTSTTTNDPPTTSTIILQAISPNTVSNQQQQQQDHDNNNTPQNTNDTVEIHHEFSNTTPPIIDIASSPATNSSTASNTPLIKQLAEDLDPL